MPGRVMAEEMAAQSKVDELPPELAHVTANFQPLSRLFERTAQECYNELGDVITALSSIPQQINGEVTVNGAGFVSAANAQKRLKWIAFANMHRERFIKLLVILRWSKNIEQVSQVIDLVTWMVQQNSLYQGVDDEMATLRRAMDAQKVPAPDLETALDILATGRSSKMPASQYDLPTPLSAEEVLATLQNINTILHLRLNIHEDLPRHLRDYKIASGRVTFTIPNEFEMDLSIADEDHTSQFYFIDFRFSFSPSSEIPAGNVRAQFEARANEVLATEGLAGCYDFFHDFVLTHKINILRRQAINLNRTSWAGSLSVEQVHRSLIISYWIDKPGPKNWLEIGVVSNRPTEKLASLGPPQPQSSLAVKWFRAGKEVKAVTTDMEDGILDCGQILQDYIGRDIDFILSSIADNIPDTFVEDNAQEETELEPDCALVIPLLQADELRLRIEHSTGRPHISPVSLESLRCETELNQVPHKEWANVLSAMKPSLALQSIRDQALSAGWHVWSRSASALSLRPQSWTSQHWFIGLTMGPKMQIEWSIFEHETSSKTMKPWLLESQKSFGRRTEIVTTPAPAPPAILPRWYPLAIPRATREWEAVANFALATINLVTILAAVKSFGIAVNSHVSLKPEIGLKFVLNSARFLGSSALERQLDEVLQFEIVGSQMSITAGIQIPGGTSSKKYITRRKCPTSPATWHDLTSFIQTARKEIGWNCQVSAYRAVLKAYSCRVLRSSDIALSFAYSTSPYLTCTIKRSETDPITLGGAVSSPHCRVLNSFRTMLSATSAIDPTKTMALLLRALLFTLPAMIEFDILEANQAEPLSTHVAALSWNKFKVVYKRNAEIFSTIRVNLRTHGTLSGPNRVVWMVTHDEAKLASQHITLKDHLQSLHSIHDVITTSTGAWLVPLEKIGTVLPLLDALIRALAAAPPLKSEPKEDVATQPQFDPTQAQTSRTLLPPHITGPSQPQNAQTQQQLRMQGQHVTGQQAATQGFAHTQAPQSQAQAQALALAQAQLAASAQVQARKQQNQASMQQLNMQRQQLQQQQQMMHMQMQLQQGQQGMQQNQGQGQNMMRQASQQGQQQAMRGGQRGGFVGQRGAPHQPQQQQQQRGNNKPVEIVELDD